MPYKVTIVDLLYSGHCTAACSFSANTFTSAMIIFLKVFALCRRLTLSRHPPILYPLIFGHPCIEINASIFHLWMKDLSYSFIFRAFLLPFILAHTRCARILILINGQCFMVLIFCCMFDCTSSKDQKTYHNWIHLQFYMFSTVLAIQNPCPLWRQDTSAPTLNPRRRWLSVYMLVFPIGHLRLTLHHLSAF